MLKQDSDLPGIKCLKLKGFAQFKILRLMQSESTNWNVKLGISNVKVFKSNGFKGSSWYWMNRFKTWN